MERIDLHNYEAFLLDYFEGKLDEKGIGALRTFLLAHPELEVDLEDSALPYVTAEMVDLDTKEQFKKTELNHPDEKLISYLEGTLSASERTGFEKQLKSDTELAKELEQYKKTILSADTNDVISDKRSLYRSEDDLVLNNRSVAYFEGQLSLSERVEFEKDFASSKLLQKELDLVSKTRLTAPETVVYPNKAELKKEGRVIGLFSFRQVSVAAAVLLLFGLFVIFNYANSGSETFIGGEVATVAPKVVEDEPIKTNSQPKQIEKHVPLTKDPQLANKDQKVIPRTREVKERKAENINPISTSQGSHLAVLEPKKENDAVNTNSAVKVSTNNSVATAEPKKEKPATVTPTLEALKELASNETVVPKEKTREVTVTVEATQNQNATLTENTGNKTIATLVEEYDADDDAETPVKRGFWRKVADLAKQVNKLGVKTVDVEEGSRNAFILSFNQFSVEKK